MLYEMSTGKPFYFKADSYTSNDVLSTAYNTAVIEGRDVLPPQLPDSLSKYKSNFRRSNTARQIKTLKRFTYLEKIS